MFSLYITFESSKNYMYFDIYSVLLNTANLNSVAFYPCTKLFY